MNYVTFLFLLVIVAVLGLVAMTARIALSENSKVLNRIRDALQRVRLSKMFLKRKIDLQSYLQHTDVSEIRRQIGTCKSCTSVQTCETALENNATTNDDFSFCPNNSAIEKLRDGTS